MTNNDHIKTYHDVLSMNPLEWEHAREIASQSLGNSVDPFWGKTSRLVGHDPANLDFIMKSPTPTDAAMMHQFSGGRVLNQTLKDVMKATKSSGKVIRLKKNINIGLSKPKSNSRGSGLEQLLKEPKFKSSISQEEKGAAIRGAAIRGSGISGSGIRNKGKQKGGIGGAGISAESNASSGQLVQMIQNFKNHGNMKNTKQSLRAMLLGMNPNEHNLLGEVAAQIAGSRPSPMFGNMALGETPIVGKNHYKNIVKSAADGDLPRRIKRSGAGFMSALKHGLHTAARWVGKAAKGVVKVAPKIPKVLGKVSQVVQTGLDVAKAIGGPDVVKDKFPSLLKLADGIERGKDISEKVSKGIQDVSKIVAPAQEAAESAVV